MLVLGELQACTCDLSQVGIYVCWLKFGVSFLCVSVNPSQVIMQNTLLKISVTDLISLYHIVCVETSSCHDIKIYNISWQPYLQDLNL